MKLSIIERAWLLEILNNYKSDIINAKVARQLVDAIGFDDDEIQLVDLRMEKGKYHWNSQKDPNKEIDFGERGVSIIAEELKKLSDKKVIGINQIDLYEKFIKE